MGAQWEREVEFRGAPVLDQQLARPVERVAKIAKPAKAAASGNGAAPAEASPAVAPTPSPAGMTSTQSAREQSPARPGSAIRSGSVGARLEPPVDPRAPASQEYRSALAAYRAYLAAIAELNTGRLELMLAQKQLEARRAAVVEVVRVLGEDPLGVLEGSPPAPDEQPPAPQPSASRRSPGTRREQVLALLPRTPAEIAEMLDDISADHAREVLVKAEKVGLVRREPIVRPGRGGRPSFIWHRCDNGGPPA